MFVTLHIISYFLDGNKYNIWEGGYKLTTRKVINPSYEIFSRLVKNGNTTIYKVCKDLDISTTTIYDWRDGKSAPKTYKLIQISDYFGVDIRIFFEEE